MTTSNKVAFITGASRGIGKACGLKLAREGWHVVVAAKSVDENPKIPGTIFTAAEEISKEGPEALPVQCNVIEEESIGNAVEKTLSKFGRIDAVVNNAGALWWRNMEETPLKKFDLIMNVNARGAFAVTQAFLPQMKKQGSGHVVFMSPPVDLDILQGHIAYFISKYGMTMTAMGLAEELRGTGIYTAALWPKTVIESYATINFKMGDPSIWRKADILADATWEIIQNPEKSNGRALIDEDFLREVGYSDFDPYKCVENGTPMELNLGAMNRKKR